MKKKSSPPAKKTITPVAAKAAPKGKRSSPKKKSAAPSAPVKRKPKPSGVPKRGLMALHVASTVDRVEGIIRSYGKVNDPDEGTIVGQAVNSMLAFTNDVNTEFTKNYKPSALKAAWDIAATANYIDTH